jgi:hypothetical protein
MILKDKSYLTQAKIAIIKKSRSCPDPQPIQMDIKKAPWL